MSDSRVPDAIDALVAAWTTAMGPGVVFDGPQITGDIPPVAVCVGYDGDPEGDFEAVANWQQTWIGMQAGREVRSESFDIVCCLIAFSGDVDVRTRRLLATAAFGQLNASLRDPLNRGLGLPQPSTAEFSSGSLRQPQTGSGLEIRAPFSVHIETRV